MSRTHLLNRRKSIRMDVAFQTSRGEEITFPTTFGFDAKWHVKEFFCTPSKSGTDIQAIVSDGCIAMSILLQHGYSIELLAAALGENRSEGQENGGPPASPLGAIVRQGAQLEAERHPEPEIPEPVETAAATGDGEQSADRSAPSTFPVDGVEAGPQCAPADAPPVSAPLCESSGAIRDDGLEIPPFLRRERAAEVDGCCA